MKVRVDLVDGLLMVGRTGNHAAAFDAPKEQGGEGEAPSPMQMLLMSAGACLGMDVAAILRKSGHDFENLSVRVEGFQREEPPRVFERIRLHLTVWGDVDEDDVAAAIRVAISRYSSTVITLRRAGVEVEVSHEVISP